jgi:hypothetical protein
MKSSTIADAILRDRERKRSAAPAPEGCPGGAYRQPVLRLSASGRGSRAACWLRGANVWRKVTSPALGPKRLTNERQEITKQPAHSAL